MVSESNPSGVTIRRAARADAGPIAAIYNESVSTSTATFDTEPKSMSDREQWLDSHDDRHPVFVAEIEGEVVGWAALTKWSDRPAYSQTAESSFYVAAGHQRQGIGRALKERLIAEAQRLGFHTLLARIAEGNDASIRINRSFGFEHIGTMKQVGHKFGRRLDVHLMQLMLDRPQSAPRTGASMEVADGRGAGRNLAIVLFDDVELLDFSGPFEVFSAANRGRETPAFKVMTVAEVARPIKSHNGLRVVPQFTLDDAPKPELLLVPGGIGTRKEMHNQRLVDWVARAAASAELVMSVCTGALILAKAGLLDGLEATTHQGAIGLLSAIAPRTTVCPNRRFIDNGKVITSAGIAAGIDMSLHVVVRLFGVEAAIATASHMEYPWVQEPV